MPAAFAQPVTGKQPPPVILLVGKFLFGGKGEPTEKNKAFEAYHRFYVGTLQILLHTQKTNSIGLLPV